jgi:T1SS-143 domain-containing protein
MIVISGEQSGAASAKLPFSLEDLLQNGNLAVTAHTDGTYSIILPSGENIVFANADGSALNADTMLELADGTAINFGQINNLTNQADAITSITKPEGNTAIVVNLEAGQDVALEYGAEAVADVQRGNGFVLVTFNDGSQILFNNFDAVANADVPTSFSINGNEFNVGDNLIAALEGSVIEDLETEFAFVEPTAFGEELSADDLNAIETAAGDAQIAAEVPAEEAVTAEEIEEEVELALDDSGLDLVEIEPAAGTPSASAGGNRFDSAVDAVNILQINAIGPLGPTALEFGLPSRDLEQVDILAAPAIPGGPSITAPDQQVFEDGSVGVVVTAASAAPGNIGFQITVSISNIPATVTVNTTTSGGTYNAGTGTWTIIMAPGQSFSGGPSFAQAPNSDVDITNLLATVTQTEIATGTIITNTDTFNVIVDAVADTPNFNIVNANGDEDTAIPLNITFGLNDLDGSESAIIVIRGVPAGGTLSAGVFDIAQGGYVLTPAQLVGLTFTPPLHLSGTVTMNAEAIVYDNPSDSEITLMNNEVRVNLPFSVEINPIADAPILNVQDEQVFEDGSIGLNIDARLVDNDSSENLTVRVEGIPAGWGVDVSTSGGTYDAATGIWTITLTAGQNFLGGPVLSPPHDSDRDITVSVTAVATEIANLAQTATTTLPLTVTVDAVVDTPNVSGTITQVGVSDVYDVNLTAIATDIDGSESVTEIRISGFPAGTTLNAGTYNVGTDTWTLTPAQLAGLQATLPGAAVGAFSVQVAVDVYDTPTDAGEITLLNNATTRTINIGFNVTDDVPQILNPGNASVDESTGLVAANKVVTGQIDVDFGNDAPGTITLNGTFNPTGSLLGGVFTAGGRTIFTMTLNSATGAYTFTLMDQIDHGNPLNANDIANLGFGFVATDADGDPVTGTTTVSVVDDAPVAVNDGLIYTGATGSVNGNVVSNDDVGYDNAGSSITQITFGGVTTAIPAAGNVSIIGSFGTLAINSTGAYTYTVDPARLTGGTDQFTYTLRDGDGDTSTAILSAEIGDIDDFPILTPPATVIVDETNTYTAGGTIIVDFGRDTPGTITESGNFDTSLPIGTALTSNGNPITVSIVGGQYVGVANGLTIFTMNINNNGTFSFNLVRPIDHQNPSDPNDSLDLRFGVRVTDEDGDSTVGTVVVRVFDDGPVAVDDSLVIRETAPAATGNVLANDNDGFDDFGTVTNVQFGGTNHAVAAVGTTTIVGTYGTLVIGSNGAYIYTPVNNGNLPNGTDQFTYTLRDNDGDTDTAILNVQVTPNHIPVITNVTASGNGIADEGGVRTVTGNVIATVDDAPGTFTENGGFFASVGLLTSKGDTISVALVGGQYVGTAGGRTIFTLNVNSNGSYTFNLLDQLDHPNAGEDFINLDFGVRVTDVDGDFDDGVITIRVQDDLPTAVNDTRSVVEFQNITGNVLGNDASGFDEPARVINVQFGGTNVAVPSVGTATIVGAYGTLVLAANGSYTYTSTANVNSNQVDNFTYTIRDYDNDTTTADLIINVTDGNDIPDITSTGGIRTVDESNTHVATGTVTADFGDDNPGSFNENGIFSTSLASLTSNGDAISVAIAGGQYVGTAGGRTIFTLNVNSNGSYTFTQLDQIDHPNAANPNDSLDLRFGVRATDSNGDVDDDTIIIRVFDDGPDAVNDTDHLSAAETVETGNVRNNDDVGYDDANAAVTRINFNGTNINVPSAGNATIIGNFGTLVIAASGAYTYTRSSNAAGNDVFTYTLRDGDGDTDTANLTITLDQVAPPVTNVVASIGDAYFYEDGGVFQTLPISASFQGGDGNETFTLRVEGIPTGWSVNAPGWTFVAGGYETTASGATRSVALNSFSVRPPQNHSDADASNIKLTVTVNDPDGADPVQIDFGKAVVDAVADGVNFDYDLQTLTGSTSQHVFWQTSATYGGTFPGFAPGTGPTYTPRFSDVVGVNRIDNDGSETVTKIVVTFTGSTFGGQVPAFALSAGTAVFLPVPPGEMITFASGLQTPASYVVQYTFNSMAEYLNAQFVSGFGPLEVNMQVTTVETNLSGEEITLTNNTIVQNTAFNLTVGDISLSPLVLDLDGDGIELTNMQDAHVYFDLNADGVLERTSFVGADDALLAFDWNQDGIINDGSELFGDQGGAFGNGFESLARLDSNGDGVIDAQDAEFANLIVWRDMNNDGISQADEMVGLADVGIVSISLGGVTQTGYFNGDSFISHESTFTFADGSQGNIVDAWFNIVPVDQATNQDIYDSVAAAQEAAMADAIASASAANIGDLDMSEGDVVDFSDILEANNALQGAIDDFISLSDEEGGVAISSQGQGYGVNANLSDSGSVDIDQLIISQQQQQEVA